MASPNIASTPSTLFDRDQRLLAELERNLEAAMLAGSFRAAYEWALTKMEQGIPQALILQVIAVNAVARGAVD